jgi:hypothetical protein
MTPPDDLERLWQSQDVPKTEKNMQVLMTEATKFQSTIKRRNASEYIAGLGAAAFLAVYALGDKPVLMRAGALLIVAGTGVVMANIRLRGRAAEVAPPVSGPTEVLVAWHRRELQRQLEFLRSVPLWYVGPIIPGFVVLLGGAFIAKPEGWPVFLVVLAITLATLGSIMWLNRRGARKLEGQIRDLDG